MFIFNHISRKWTLIKIECLAKQAQSPLQIASDHSYMYLVVQYTNNI